MEEQNSYHEGMNLHQVSVPLPSQRQFDEFSAKFELEQKPQAGTSTPSVGSEVIINPSSNQEVVESPLPSTGPPSYHTLDTRGNEENAVQQGDAPASSAGSSSQSLCSQLDNESRTSVANSEMLRARMASDEHSYWSPDSSTSSSSAQSTTPTEPAAVSSSDDAITLAPIPTPDSNNQIGGPNASTRQDSRRPHISGPYPYFDHDSRFRTNDRTFGMRIAGTMPVPLQEWPEGWFENPRPAPPVPVARNEASPEENARVRGRRLLDRFIHAARLTRIVARLRNGTRKAVNKVKSLGK
ncbi:hypothetical protein BGW36DRAFT_429126 [Talaromyces proteolyticus]|uniref:Uncharacterized protein n=1 Tax=Talaromyces proteolyticus TaxID=1131652 RepID=A0AAD4PWM1_9EURO|nr:uncharacterized protein BGW36DRAFT_429126 [Talaromyces proteolyticus]KAH8695245.1 hypothetical protein BGW36DRAFT_429126 [Talaromyces proteolyticus]